jgi:hypothetical protein
LGVRDILSLRMVIIFLLKKIVQLTSFFRQVEKLCIIQKQQTYGSLNLKGLTSHFPFSLLPHDIDLAPSTLTRMNGFWPAVFIWISTGVVRTRLVL